jgi:hydrogenase large subunit
MTEWGRKRYITPGVAIGGELISTDLVEINLMIRILLGSSYFDGWENEPTFVDPRPARQPGRQEPPVEQGHAAEAAEARLHGQVHLGRLAADLRQAHRHARLLRHRRRSVRPPVVHGEGRPLVDFGYAKATGHSIQMVLPRSPNMPEMELEWHVPEKSNAIERDRARTYHQAYSALIALHNLERAMKEVQAGRTKSWNKFKVPTARSAAASTRRPAACSRTTW